MDADTPAATPPTENASHNTLGVVNKDQLALKHSLLLASVICVLSFFCGYLFTLSSHGGFSLILSVFFLCMVVLFSWLKVKRSNEHAEHALAEKKKKEVDGLHEFSSEDRAIILQSLPPWVKYPNVAKTEWINDILEVL